MIWKAKEVQRAVIKTKVLGKMKEAGAAKCSIITSAIQREPIFSLLVFFCLFVFFFPEGPAAQFACMSGCHLRKCVCQQDVSFYLVNRTCTKHQSVLNHTVKQLSPTEV